MKFLVPNYSCLQDPWLGGLPPPDPRSLCPLSSTEFVESPPPPKKIPGYSTDHLHLQLVDTRGEIKGERKKEKFDTAINSS